MADEPDRDAPTPRLTRQWQAPVFWELVDKEGPIPAHCPELGPCYIWRGNRAKNGYGRIWMPEEKRMEGAHRFALAQHLGRPLIAHALHKCDNPICVRAQHLFEGTQRDNISDCFQKGRFARGERNGSYMQPHRRPRGEGHGAHTKPESVPQGSSRPNAKLSEAVIGEIRQKCAQGRIQREVALEYGVSQSAISWMVTGKGWRHV